MIAKLLGDRVDMVIKVYSHLMPENLATAIRVIDDAIDERGENAA